MIINFSIITRTGVEIAQFDSSDLGGPGTSMEEMTKAARKIYEELLPDKEIMFFDTQENISKKFGM